MKRPQPSLMEKLGCWWHERWRAEAVMLAPVIAAPLGLTWLDLRNRRERLSTDAVSGGRVCEWADSSRLTLTRVFPGLGIRLLRHATRQWPIKLEFGPKAPTECTPKVSMLIPIGGTSRLPQFELALAAARSQVGIEVEVVVVEQSIEATLGDRLPGDVRYLHQPADVSAPGFNKSRALNLAAAHARGETLVVLDADYLVPVSFAAQCHQVLQRAEAVRPARLIFYLDEASTRRVHSDRTLEPVAALEMVVENNPTPIAVRSQTYWQIGGHDEDYVGWGGEDTEFLDRLRTRHVAEGGWLPVVHAWHAAAPKKSDGDRNRELHQKKMASDVHGRIRTLVDRMGACDRKNLGNGTSLQEQHRE